MVRNLRWAALIAILALPLILYLGRKPEYRGCEPKPGGVPSVCNPLPVSPIWVAPVFYTVLGIAILLLVLAIVVNNRPNEGESRDSN
jgi:hypothetical protein